MERRSATFGGSATDRSLIPRDATPTLSPAREIAASRPAATGFSLLRLSVPARLAIVGVAAAALWAAVLWALA